MSDVAEKAMKEAKARAAGGEEEIPDFIKAEKKVKGK